MRICRPLYKKVHTLAYRTCDGSVYHTKLAKMSFGYSISQLRFLLFFHVRISHADCDDDGDYDDGDD